MKNPSDRPNFRQLKQDFEIAMNEPGKFINVWLKLFYQKRFF